MTTSDQSESRQSFWRIRKSDPEYLEGIRRKVKNGPKWAALDLFCGLLALALFEIIRRSIYGDQMLACFLGPQDTGYRHGLAAGACAGAFLILAMNRFQNAARSLHGFRTEKLLLSAINRVQELEKQPQQRDRCEPPEPSSFRADAGGSARPGGY